MSPFDIVVLAVTAVATLAVLFGRVPLKGGLRLLPYVALGLAGVHLAAAYRTSFIPVYGIAALVALCARPTTYGRPGLRRAIGATSLVALTAGGMLAALFPMFTLPAPTGPHRIGTSYLALTDTSRSEDLSPDTTDRRRLLVRFWYPADSVVGPPVPLMSSRQATGLAQAFTLPSLTFSHLERIPTHGHLDAALSNKEQQWPVVVFSHGFGIGYESQNTVQMEELASHGYVVASIAHTYEAGIVAFPDGSLARGGQDVAPDSAALVRLTSLVPALATETDTGKLRDLVAEMRGVMDLTPSMLRWVADTRFVLDQLRDVWPGRLRLDRIGIFGMSFGGATAASFCTVDERCAAGINLDGLAFGASTEQAMPRPFMFVTSASNRHMHDLYFARALAPATRLTVARSLHLDFTDLGFISPLFVRMGILGGIPPREMHGIMNAAVRAQFDHYLRGAPLDYSRLTSYSQVTLDQQPAR